MTAIPVRTADVASPSSSPSPSPETAPDGGAQPGAREDLRSYAELGGFTLSAQTHAWYAAVDTIGSPEEARAASTVLAELRGRDLLAVRDAATRLAEGTVLGEPSTVGETNRAVTLLLRVRDTLATLRPTAYEADLDALAAATANGTRRKDQGDAAKLSWIRRWTLTGRARGLAVSKRTRRDALHTALVAAAADRTDWAALAPEGGNPALPSDPAFLDDAGRAVEAAGTGLRELGRLLLADPRLDTLAFDDLSDLLDRLAADEGTLYRLPTLRTLRDRLTEHGLTDLLTELTARRADAAEAEAAYGAGDAEAAAAVEAAAEPAPAAVADPEPEVEPEPTVEPVADLASDVPAPVVEAEPEPEPVKPTESVLTEPEPEAVKPSESTESVLTEPEPEAVKPTESVLTEPTESEPVKPTESVLTEPTESGPVEPTESVVTGPDPVELTAHELTAQEATAQEATASEATASEATVSEPGELTAASEAKAAPVRRPRKPSVTPGRPITAYSARELTGLVRWIDTDVVERTDDELLRAAMKELGFARIGPRIKEALGAAVAEVRGPKA